MINSFKLKLYGFLANFTLGKVKCFCIDKKQKYKELIILKKNKANIIVNGSNNRYNTDILAKLGVKLTVNGNNNEIIVGENSNIQGTLDIRLNGDNNKIYLGNISTIVNLTIIAGFENNNTKNSEIYVKDNTSFNEVKIILLEHNSMLKIGKGCMFSGNIVLHLTDGHSIIDYDGNLLNYGANVSIGDRVWVGRNVTILKHASIPDGTIIGMGSIVSKKYDEENTIIAGIPAKVVKHNVLWENTPPQIYLDNSTKMIGENVLCQ